MTATHIEIRRLTEASAGDAVLYRDIRLEALRTNPEAFGSTFEIEVAKHLDWFSAGLANSTLLGAFRGAQLLAIAGFAIQQGQKEAHKGLIWGMYVRPDARRAGIGRRLIEAILESCSSSRRIGPANGRAGERGGAAPICEYGLSGVRHREEWSQAKRSLL
jgi:GNAT superfamily N-acetyltransferase